MINILIVDDSMTETILLKKIFESEPDMRVIGCAKNGKEAVELAAQLKPDVITMDIVMPVMDGYEATRMIMSKTPVPIVVISSKANSNSLAITFEALEAGALSVLGKPLDVSAAAFDRECKRIIETVRSMSEIKVIKHKFYPKPSRAFTKRPLKVPKSTYYEIVGIGTSVGGPQVLRTILANLPSDFPLPIVVVQHMSQGFMTGFTKWLNDLSPLRVKEAEDNEVLTKGTVYFAPDQHHLEIHRIDDHLVAKLIDKDPVSGFCPSATVLLQSIAKASGQHAIGILLTGMGSDGAEGLLALKNTQGHTLVQDPKSAVVFGMAGVARALGAVDKVVEIDKMADYLCKLVKKCTP